MITTNIIGIVLACILIAAVTSIGIMVVLFFIHLFRRTLSPDRPSAAQIDSAPASSTGLPYARIPHLLTAAEGDFFATLQAAAPAGMVIFAQVRLANLVQVQRWARRDKTNWYKIQAKCVDFVVCEPRTFISRLVIELDDSSHSRADRRVRDAFVDDILAAAGLPILHVRWQRRYDPRDLAQQIAIKLPSAPPAAASWVPLPAAASAIPTAPLPISTPPPASLRRACGQCQAQLSEQSKFCARCGALFMLG
jgi:very-short-patch-repair endonuclease